MNGDALATVRDAEHSATHAFFRCLRVHDPISHVMCIDTYACWPAEAFHIEEMQRATRMYWRTKRTKDFFSRPRFPKSRRKPEISLPSERHYYIQKNKIVNSANVVTESDAAMSKLLQLLIGTHSVLGEIHNIDVIVDTVIQLAPATNWVDVMEDDGFSIPDESALNLMMSIYTLACKEPLPLNNVFQSLWKNTEGQNCLMKFVDMCQEFKMMHAVLDCTPLTFSIKLAIAASRKDHSLIDKWLSAKSGAYKACFLQECANFLEGIMSSTPMEQPEAQVMNIYWGSFPFFIEVCQSHSGELLPIQVLDEHSTVCYGTIRNKLEEQVKDMMLKYIMRPNSLDRIKDCIGKLLEDQQFCMNLIVQEKQEVFELKGQTLECHFDYWIHNSCEEEYGPVISRLRTLARSNDEALKYLTKGLHKFFNGDDLLLCQVDAIYNRNKAASKRAGLLIFEYHDYLNKANKEASWIRVAKQRVDKVYGLLSGGATVLAELNEMESHVADLNERVALLSKERTQNFHSHCQDLDILAKIYEDIGILSKKLLLVTKAVEELCLMSNNLRILLSEKVMNSTRFHNTEQHLEEEKKSSKMSQELLDIELAVQQARIPFKEKMAGLPEVGDDRYKEYEQVLVDKAMSWRTRRLHERKITGEMRKQGRDMCAFVSTVVMRESLGKREDAIYRLRFAGQHGRQYRPDQHFLKLSEDHLQDIYIAFCSKNKRRGREKLDVCMERMQETGVVSDYDYKNIADEEDGRRFERYKISYFESMEASDYNEAFHKLDQARVLVGTFGITKGYFRLGPKDIYDAPKEAVFETSETGNRLTHAVVIVGYGVSPDGIPFYAFQNWYGPTWGKGGFGMVTCQSIIQLYSAEL